MHKRARLYFENHYSAHSSCDLTSHSRNSNRSVPTGCKGIPRVLSECGFGMRSKFDTNSSMTSFIAPFCSKEATSSDTMVSSRFEKRRVTGWLNCIGECSNSIEQFATASKTHLSEVMHLGVFLLVLIAG